MKRLLFVTIVVALFVSACAQATPTNTPATGPSYQTITPAQLKSMLQNKDFLLVNVHIPYVAEIEGTDLFVPYNEIQQNDKLPSDKAAKIVVYCQSGA